MIPQYFRTNRRIGASAAAALAPAKAGARITPPFNLSSPSRLLDQSRRQGRRRTAPKAAESQAASSSAPSSSSNNNTKVQVVFLREAAVVEDAAVGEPLADVARRAGVDSIQYGCHLGNCGVCEVELRRYKSGGEGKGGNDASTVVVRACVAVVPADSSRVEIDLLDDGGAWGLDGWDT
jgi:hypothetical protein